MLYQSLFSVAGFATTVLSHGVITSPPIRAVGDAMTAACGQAISDHAALDVNDHVEGLPEIVATTANFDAAACNVFLCRGMQFGDNTANVQNFAPGDVVNMLASLPILHEGPMNVSIVDTKTNAAIGDPLIVFDSYADESLAQIPANNTNFDVTIPSTLGTACSVAGDCVLQWFWFGTAADQTYESCVDMVVSDAAASTPAKVASPVVSPAKDSSGTLVASPATVGSDPAIVAVADPVTSAVVSPTAAVVSSPVSSSVASPTKATKASNKKGKGKGAKVATPSSTAVAVTGSTGCVAKRTVTVVRAKKFNA